jgi:plasmid replication initiation protein
VITAPEIEMLIIYNEDAYEHFKRSGLKPSDFCKAKLRMHDVKSYEFVKSYFSNSKTLLHAIHEYHRTANIPNGEYTLFDLLK